MSRLFAAALFAALLGAAAPVAATEDSADDSPFRKECLEFYETCKAECAARNPDTESGGYHGCIARCRTEQGACEAARTYEEAKPWVQDKLNDMQRFLDEFFRDEPPSAPPPATPENNGGEEEGESQSI